MVHTHCGQAFIYSATIHVRSRRRAKWFLDAESEQYDKKYFHKHFTKRLTDNDLQSKTSMLS